MGYCAISDVTDAFPSFQRQAAGSISDARIQTWIDQYASRIRAALMQRGVDPGWNSGTSVGTASLPGGATISVDQSNWLLLLNADGAIGELGRALEGNVTLQPGEISVVGGRRKNYEMVLAAVAKGAYDAYWGLPSRLAGSIGGAEEDHTTPRQRDENRQFGINQKF